MSDDEVASDVSSRYFFTGEVAGDALGVRGQRHHLVESQRVLSSFPYLLNNDTTAYEPNFKTRDLLREL